MLNSPYQVARRSTAAQVLMDEEAGHQADGSAVHKVSWEIVICLCVSLRIYELHHHLCIVADEWRKCMQRSVKTNNKIGGQVYSPI